jgi:catechol 2,3-dioxygenase-like lactoylglutathione lyase family enzyme
VVKNADHVTLVVRDVEAAKKFFALLGFKDEIDTVISGEALSTYMGIKNIEAEHITLVLQGCTPRFEIQLLHYMKPPILKIPTPPTCIAPATIIWLCAWKIWTAK